MRQRLRSALLFVGLLFLGLTAPGGGSAQAAPDVYASPVHAGCYIAGPSDCRIHVEPFTINIASGRKMVRFQLYLQQPAGPGTAIYDWRPDSSNPPPSSGTTYTPSLVAMDYGATCGKSYVLYLQGQDTGDANMYNLGATGTFTCPAAIP